jgi:hypothetical protein
MINQKQCPFCKGFSGKGCEHLALVVEARDFVRSCIERSAALRQWEALCALRRQARRNGGDWSPEQDDFTWLETAFCDEFLKRLSWFGGMDYEWRTGPKPEQGGFWVLLWSKAPQKMWWELRDELDRASARASVPDRTPRLL